MKQHITKRIAKVAFVALVAVVGFQMAIRAERYAWQHMPSADAFLADHVFPPGDFNQQKAMSLALKCRDKPETIKSGDNVLVSCGRYWPSARRYVVEGPSALQAFGLDVRDTKENAPIEWQVPMPKGCCTRIRTPE